MPVQKINVSTIGKVARDALSNARSASVLGKISRGLFLHLPDGWVIFLSIEAHHGPLTLNLQEDPALLHRPEIGSIGHCSPAEISFPELQIALPGSGVSPWQAPAPPAEISSPGQIRAQLQSVARLAIHNGAAGRLIPLLPLVLDGLEQPGLQEKPFGLELVRLQTACRARRLPAIAAALRAFLGLGAGLTPSGDDLITGYLLAANRWGERLVPTFDLAALNQDILASARKATNSLSASLIQCAAQGQADERLILALDGIIAGAPDASACFTALAGWGSSSGFDALVGMAIFLTHGISLTSSM